VENPKATRGVPPLVGWELLCIGKPRAGSRPSIPVPFSRPGIGGTGARAARGGETRLALTVPDGTHIIKTGMEGESTRAVTSDERKTEDHVRIDNQVNKRAGTTRHRNLSGEF